MNNTIEAFAPATIANLACGFDKLGVAIEPITQLKNERVKGVGDWVSVSFVELKDDVESFENIKDTIEIDNIIINGKTIKKPNQFENKDLKEETIFDIEKDEDFVLYYPSANKLTIPIISYLQALQKALLKEDKKNSELTSKINPLIANLIKENRFLIKIKIEKNIPLASGLGSSAASAVVGVYASN